MRIYGDKKATEFTKKQINVIYAKNKKGELNVSKKVLNDFYNLADFYGYDDNRTVESCEAAILNILDNVFGNNNEEAQHLINCYEKRFYIK